MRIVYVISYRDHMYPEDNYTMGVGFPSEEEANQAIKSECANWSSDNHHAAEYNYTVHEILFDFEPTVIPE